ncbi:putative ankyrin-containing lipoprotein Lxx09580 [Haliotis asinina]|uniref:putative ankyrin-containing lipoprotein Lxx09580 n=1 Tax=Haliotis asinina TaxID=109174 RepID=UPI0035318D10
MDKSASKQDSGSTKQSTPKKTDRDGYVIKNIGIKLCQLKCAERGQCVNIDYDAETLTCRLSIDESPIEKKEGPANLAPSADQRPSNTVPPAPVTTQDSDPQGSTTDASQDLTPSKTVPPAPVTTQDCNPHATPSAAAGRDLYDASRDGDLERVKRILAARHVDINYRGGWSRTPVMVAAYRGHRDVVEFLVGRGADVSLVDRDGDNVLHFACISGHLEIVKLTLSLDLVHVNARNNDGDTAADIARGRGRQRVLDLLVSHGAH